MPYDLHPVYYYAQQFIKRYHDELAERTSPHAQENVSVSAMFDSKIRRCESGDGCIEVNPDFQVGIIGGGVGGLFAAMLLQHCGIRYQILERSKDLGGRLYTHRFSDKENDYYDVGAMRYPQSPLMRDVFKLFKKIGIMDRIIPYHFTVDTNLLYFNGVRKPRKDTTITQASTFKIDAIPEPYASIGWEKLAEYAIKPFKDALVKDNDDNKKEGWELLMRYDAYSARTYMERFNLIVRADDKDLLNPKGWLPYPEIVVDWLELFNTSTNSYTYAFSEMVLDDLAFAWPNVNDWSCIQGGSRNITEGMHKWLAAQAPDIDKNILKNARVTAISQDDSASPNERMQVEYGDGSVARYAHVITTTALSCLSAVDLSEAKLTFFQKTAIRSLTYGAATKVGVKFESPWWTDAAVMRQYGGIEPISAGQSITDWMSRVVVYPSYGKDDRSSVLIASYAWTSDAQALGSLFASENAKELKRIILRDLVKVHNFNAEGAVYLEDQWVEAFPHNWSTDPRTMGGAYAQFNSGQFSQLYPALTMPSAGQRLWFAGEVISAEHAWVSGALAASARAVKGLILASCGENSKELQRYNAFWDDTEDVVEINYPVEEDPWINPEGWTTKRLTRQLAASMLSDDCLATVPLGRY